MLQKGGARTPHPSRPPMACPPPQSHSHGNGRLERTRPRQGPWRRGGLSLRGGGEEKWVRNAKKNDRSRGRTLLHGQDMNKKREHRNSVEQWLAAVGGGRLVVGGWRLVVGCWRLAVGGWRLAVGGGRLVVGCWRLVVGGWWLAVGGWWLAVGGWRFLRVVLKGCP